MSDPAAYKCPTCYGEGEVEHDLPSYHGPMSDFHPCPDCPRVTCAVCDESVPEPLTDFHSICRDCHDKAMRKAMRDTGPARGALR